MINMFYLKPDITKDILNVNNIYIYLQFINIWFINKTNIFIVSIL